MVQKEQLSMSFEEENKEITVRAPTKPSVSPEKQAEKSAEKALEEERFKVLQFPKKISRFFGMVIAVMGVLLLLVVVYVGATGQTGGVLLAAESSPVSIAAWGLVGSLNIIVGFIFLGRE